MMFRCLLIVTFFLAVTYAESKQDACAGIQCPLGATCVSSPAENCPSGHCPEKPTCLGPCSRIRCPGDYKCVEILVNCLQNTNCTPGLRGQCVPRNKLDPCFNKECPPGQSCYLSKTGPDPHSPEEAKCRDVCYGVPCEPGKYCYAEEVQCIRAPCYPVATCKEPCEARNCPQGTKCMILRVGIPCQKSSCKPNTICVPQNSTSPKSN